MSDLTKRLRASVRMDAHNGDSMERGVCGKQMLEAADEIERLTRERDEAREYGAQARIRENQAEDRRIHDVDAARKERDEAVALLKVARNSLNAFEDHLAVRIDALLARLKG